MISVPILGVGSTPVPIVAFNPADKDVNITLSNNNLTATSSSVASFKSVRVVGPYKSAGKGYFRGTLVSATQSGSGFMTSTAPLNDLFGQAAGQGVGAYANPGVGSIVIRYHGGNAGSGPTVASHDWIVVAIDLGTGNFWCTSQTAAGGVLNTNWNNGANSPAAGTGAFATDLAGVLVLPAVSLLTSTDTSTIDANTIISDATLSGFVPWARL